MSYVPKNSNKYDMFALKFNENAVLRLVSLKIQSYLLSCFARNYRLKISIAYVCYLKSPLPLYVVMRIVGTPSLPSECTYFLNGPHDCGISTLPASVVSLTIGSVQIIVMKSVFLE